MRSTSASRAPHTAEPESAGWKMESARSGNGSQTHPVRERKARSGAASAGCGQRQREEAPRERLKDMESAASLQDRRAPPSPANLAVQQPTAQAVRDGNGCNKEESCSQACAASEVLFQVLHESLPSNGAFSSQEKRSGHAPRRRAAARSSRSDLRDSNTVCGRTEATQARQGAQVIGRGQSTRVLCRVSGCPGLLS